MLHDVGTCIRCGSRYQYDIPREIGSVDHCDECESRFIVGPFVGTFYDNFLVRKVVPPSCPKCKSKNTLCGMKVRKSLAEPDLHLRQCNECHTVWMGNYWYTESLTVPNPNPEYL